MAALFNKLILLDKFRLFTLSTLENFNDLKNVLSDFEFQLCERTLAIAVPCNFQCHHLASPNNMKYLHLETAKICYKNVNLEPKIKNKSVFGFFEAF